MVVLETERLIIRAWRSGDLNPYAEMCALPQVMRYIGAGAVRTRAECVDNITHFTSEFDANGFGLLALELRSNNQFVGFCGLSVPHFLPEILPAVEIGWRLAPAVWGQGLATEAARVVLAHGFDHLELAEIVSICHSDNIASRKVMLKLGMVLAHETVLQGRAVEVFKITRAV